MLSEVRCPECGATLALPPGSEGRRLRCPSCSKIFLNAAKPRPTQEPPRPPAQPSRPAAPRMVTAYLDDDEPPIARQDAPLRDMFGPALLGSDETPPPRGPAANDALALFQDDPPSRRKPTAAETRAKAKRCPSCHGFVPAGMTLCSTCGLDLETGTRIELADEFEEVHERGPSGPPFGILLPGLLYLATAIILGITALIGYQKGVGGAEFLGIICLFGIYASVQFLRMRSTKLLFVALTLGLLVGITGLIIIPVYSAVNQVEVVLRTDEEEDGTEIKSVKEQIDTTKLSWGVTVMILYALSAVYINSPPVRKHFRI